MIGGDRSVLQGKKSAFWYTLEEFSKHWDRIDVICPKVKNSRTKIQEPIHGNVYFHPSPKRLWYQPFWIYKKGKELHEKIKFDAMTVHEYPPFYNGIGARWLYKKTFIPYELEIHHIVGYPKSASFFEYIGRLMSLFYLPIDAHTAAAVRTVNEKTKNQLERWGIPGNKIQVVPSFYLDRKLLSSIKDQPIKYDLATCARLVKNKGIEELIQAVKFLPELSLVIIGDGPEMRNIHNLVCKKGINNRVTLKGWLPTQKDVMETIKSARIFVMNSKSEGGPRILLEAMAIGMPVISTPVGIVNDVISSNVNGVISTGSAHNLSYKIKALMADEALQKKIGKEARKVMDKFDRSTLIKNYADFVKSLK